MEGGVESHLHPSTRQLIVGGELPEREDGRRPGLRRGDQLHRGPERRPRWRPTCPRPWSQAPAGPLTSPPAESFPVLLPDLHLPTPSPPSQRSASTAYPASPALQICSRRVPRELLAQPGTHPWLCASPALLFWASASPYSESQFSPRSALRGAYVNPVFPRCPVPSVCPGMAGVPGVCRPFTDLVQNTLPVGPPALRISAPTHVAVPLPARPTRHCHGQLFPNITGDFRFTCVSLKTQCDWCLLVLGSLQPAQWHLAALWRGPHLTSPKLHTSNSTLPNLFLWSS